MPRVWREYIYEEDALKDELVGMDIYGTPYAIAPLGIAAAFLINVGPPPLPPRPPIDAPA